MSRIGRRPIPVPEAVTISMEGQDITVKGKKGELSFNIPETVSVTQDEQTLSVERHGDDKQSRTDHGMVRATIANMVHGVSQGFEKALEIKGVGYRAQTQGATLVLNLGYSNPINFDPPEGIELATDGPTKIFVRGIDRQKVGQVAANIRGLRPPEPYKGKGVRYAGEYVQIKAGKAGAQ
ncbi:MAG: 50S ribosomal protein L6 [Synergistales bacterium]|nr:50S ribosomal protein L6 [Synergistales bacterium]